MTSPSNGGMNGSRPSSLPKLRAEYAYYRESVRWQMIRRAVRLRAKGKCEICYRLDGAECAHLTYERIGNERLTDLLWICRECHASLDVEGR